jgi:hypothetical protein
MPQARRPSLGRDPVGCHASRYNRQCAPEHRRCPRFAHRCAAVRQLSPSIWDATLLVAELGFPMVRVPPMRTVSRNYSAFAGSFSPAPSAPRTILRIQALTNLRLAQFHSKGWGYPSTCFSIMPLTTASANAYPSFHLLPRGPATFKIPIPFVSTNAVTAATASNSDICRASMTIYGLFSNAHRFRVSRVPPDSDSQNTQDIAARMRRRTRVREASRSHASDSPVPGEDRISERPGPSKNTRHYPPH